MGDELKKEFVPDYIVVLNEITIVNNILQYKHHLFAVGHESHLNDYHNFHGRKEQFPSSLSRVHRILNRLPRRVRNEWVNTSHYLSSMIVHNDQYDLEEGCVHLFLKSPRIIYIQDEDLESIPTIHYIHSH